MDRYWRGTAFVLISAVSYGFMPIFARFAYESGFGVPELLLLRFALAFVVMGSFLRVTRKGLSTTKKQLFFLLALGGIGYFVLSSLYYVSLLYISVPVQALIFYTYPVFVTTGSLALGWEKASVPLASSLLLALMGLYLVVNPIINIVIIGFLLALGAAITYTIYILASTRALKGLSGEVASFHVIGAAALSFLIFDSLTGSVHIAWNYESWVWPILIAIVSTAIAMTAFFQGIKLIGPSTASVLSLTEPITSVIAASILFNELLNMYQWIGGLLILLATIIAAISKAKEQKNLGRI